MKNRTLKRLRRSSRRFLSSSSSPAGMSSFFKFISLIRVSARCEIDPVLAISRWNRSTMLFVVILHVISTRCTMRVIARAIRIFLRPIFCTNCCALFLWLSMSLIWLIIDEILSSFVFSNLPCFFCSFSFSLSFTSIAAVRSLINSFFTFKSSSKNFI